MKYNVNKVLLNNNETLSHLFLETVSKDKELMAKLTPPKNLSREKGDAREFEIELFIEGHSVNPKAFFDQFAAQYEDMVHAHAVELIRKKMNSAIEKLSDMKQAVEHLGQEINWNVSNPFKEPA